jgi:hypothetical protein
MKKSKIYKKLEILIQGVFIYDYRITQEIKELYQQDKIKLISAEWCDHWKQIHPEYYPLNLKDNDLWCTYSECTTLFLHIKDDKILVDVDIYDGEMLHGRRKAKRWEAKFEINQYHLKLFIKNINWKFDNYLDDLYEQELEIQKQRRKLQLAKEMLS